MYRLLAFDRPLLQIADQVANPTDGTIVEVDVGQHGLDRGIFHGDVTPDAALFSARPPNDGRPGTTLAKLTGTSVHCTMDCVDTRGANYESARNYWSNSILWNAFHDTRPAIATMSRSREDFELSYDRMNRRFAKQAVNRIKRDSHGRAHIFWQDYQLLGAPKYFRQSHLANFDRITTSHFLHVPFPAVPSFLELPEWLQRYTVEGLLSNNRIVFQTQGDVERFMRVVGECFGYEHSSESSIHWDGRDVELHASPFPLDIAWLREAARSPAAREFREYVQSRCRQSPSDVVIGLVGRIDGIKQLPTAIRAIGDAVEQLRHPMNISVVACCQPARLEDQSGVTEFEDFRRAVDELRSKWRHSSSTIELYTSPDVYRAVALYTECDILVVPSLRDGLNLVGAEGALLTERNGVSVLSNSTGLAEYMKTDEAIHVEPTRDGLRDGIIRALQLPPTQRAAMSKRAKERVQAMPWPEWIRTQEG